MRLTAHEVNIVRQWFNAVQDVNPAYLTKKRPLRNQQYRTPCEWAAPYIK